MADAPASLDAIYRVARLVGDEGIPYAFIGGVALNTWAIPRATFDLDLAVSLSAKQVPELLSRFQSADFVLDPAFERGFRDRIAGMEKIHVHLPAGAALMAVDIFFAETPFLRSVLERSVAIDLGQGLLQVCTAADLLLFKLLADRPKDRADVRNVLAVQGIPDREYLERWAGELDVRPRLDELLRGAGGSFT